uniref:Non-specific serine/threonine protein kinase n=1 Tax=Panagrolaimus sp. ES5 TaxID=591445 RepID=A0AC34F4H1_9BILA
MLESWFYLLVELTVGKLPWAAFSRHEKDKIAESKRRARTSGRKQFLAHCPTQYGFFMDLIDRWQFDDMPDYDGLYVMITRLLDVIGVKFDDMYDWETLEKYKQTPPSLTTNEDKLKLFDHCIFASHAELQKLVESSPAPPE